MGIAGFPVTRTELRQAVQRALNRKQVVSEFKDNLPSTSWIQKFLVRHKISLRKPENLEVSKAQMSEAEIQSWMSNLRTFLE